MADPDRQRFLQLELQAYRHQFPNRKNLPGGTSKGKLWDSLDPAVYADLAYALQEYAERLEALTTEMVQQRTGRVPRNLGRVVAVRKWITGNEEEVLERYEELIGAIGVLIQSRGAAPQGKMTVTYLRAEEARQTRERDALRGILDSLRTRLHAFGNARRMKVGKLSEAAGWTYVRELGEGGFGVAHFYVQQAQDGTIIDRVVAKDAATDGHRSTWGIDRLGRHIPHEIRALFALRPLVGSDRVVKIRRWNMHSGGNFYRVFMEFCGMGDLFSLMANYGEQTGSVTRPRQYIPEPFLWKLLEDVVTAGILMERGDLRPTQRPWDVIVHRDWRTINMFLGTNTSQSFRGYPTAKTGDFGWSAIIPHNKPYKGFDYYSSFRWEHWAPEQNWDMQRELGTKTNVWACGHVLQGAVTLQDPDQGYLMSGYQRASPWADDVERHYSKDLLDLIMSCLARDPRNRPTFDVLLRKIRRRTGDGSIDLARGLRFADKDNRGFQRHALLGLAEGYPMGDMLADAMKGSAPKRPDPQESQGSDYVSETPRYSGDGDEDDGNDDDEDEDGGGDDSDEDGGGPAASGSSAGPGAETSAQGPRRGGRGKRPLSAHGPQRPKIMLKLKRPRPEGDAAGDAPKSPAKKRKLKIKGPRKPAGQSQAVQPSARRSGSRRLTPSAGEGVEE
ncbi:unnamed protein product [Lecanosticta acicola]|uniref:non-specific serine/threonine protein kinase n=1 Tax=Lecanosticta acicola TaxID=111012 RepID=A0AAI8YR48_9PEZI|nr:unnamed protein product [Lecanosticta acicola]